MSQYTLYYSPDSANLVVRMALEEAGADYTAILIDRGQREQRSEAFLQLNPQGLLPVLVYGGVVLFETAAILLYLVDQYPALGPQVDSPARGDLYRWLFYLSNTLHADLRVRFYAERYLTDPRHLPELKLGVAQRLLSHLDLLDKHILQHDHGFLLESGFSVCDLYLAVCCRWLMIYPPNEALSPMEIARYSNIEVLLARLEQRFSVITACKKEWIEPPLLTRPTMPRPPTGSVLG